MKFKNIITLAIIASMISLIPHIVAQSGSFASSGSLGSTSGSGSGSGGNLSSGTSSTYLSRRVSPEFLQILPSKDKNNYRQRRYLDYADAHATHGLFGRFRDTVAYAEGSGSGFRMSTRSERSNQIRLQASLSSAADSNRYRSWYSSNELGRQRNSIPSPNSNLNAIMDHNSNQMFDRNLPPIGRDFNSGLRRNTGTYYSPYQYD